MDNQNYTPAQNDNNKLPKRHSKASIVTLILLAIILQFVVLLGIVRYLDKESDTGEAVVEDTAQIVITDSGFEPQTLGVKKGTQVTWINSSTQERIVASGPFPSNDQLEYLNSDQPLNPDDEYSYVFEDAGTFYYIDNLNHETFSGTVIVEE